jgi:LmbE family N-acetylglucosaminyl deacetylase
VTTDLTGAGTPERAWQAWPALQAWLPLSNSPPPASVVAVAPHPDDEVLGVGGLLALLGKRGARVHVIAVTDGDASHPKSPTLTPAVLAHRRIIEAEQARKALGIENATVERLRLPDGQVRDVEAHHGSITAAVLRALARLADDGPAWCLAPWPGDGHPDHAAAGQAAMLGASGTARVMTYPVWMWHWASPNDARVPWWAARRVVLPPEVRRAKETAIAAFQTQIAPLSNDPADATILPPHVLAHLTREVEVVFELG